MQSPEEDVPYASRVYLALGRDLAESFPPGAEPSGEVWVRAWTNCLQAAEAALTADTFQAVSKTTQGARGSKPGPVTPPKAPRCAFCICGAEAQPSLGALLEFATPGGGHTLAVHTRCAQWAPQVFQPDVPTEEAQHGFLGVDKEVRRASRLVCKKCHLKGAAIGCMIDHCKHSYHLPCLMQLENARFDCSAWTAYCPTHAARAPETALSSNQYKELLELAAQQAQQAQQQPASQPHQPPAGRDSGLCGQDFGQRSTAVPPAPAAAGQQQQPHPTAHGAAQQQQQQQQQPAAHAADADARQQSHAREPCAGVADTGRKPSQGSRFPRGGTKGSAGPPRIPHLDGKKRRLRDGAHHGSGAEGPQPPQQQAVQHAPPPASHGGDASMPKGAAQQAERGGNPLVQKLGRCAGGSQPVPAGVACWWKPGRMGLSHVGGAPLAGHVGKGLRGKPGSLGDEGVRRLWQVLGRAAEVSRMAGAEPSVEGSHAGAVGATARSAMHEEAAPAASGGKGAAAAHVLLRDGSEGSGGEAVPEEGPADSNAHSAAGGGAKPGSNRGPLAGSAAAQLVECTSSQCTAHAATVTGASGGHLPRAKRSAASLVAAIEASLPRAQLAQPRPKRSRQELLRAADSGMCALDAQLSREPHPQRLAAAPGIPAVRVKQEPREPALPPAAAAEVPSPAKVHRPSPSSAPTAAAAGLTHPTAKQRKQPLGNAQPQPPAAAPRAPSLPPGSPASRLGSTAAAAAGTSPAEGRSQHPPTGAEAGQQAVKRQQRRRGRQCQDQGQAGKQPLQEAPAPQETPGVEEERGPLPAAASGAVPAQVAPPAELAAPQPAATPAPELSSAAADRASLAGIGSAGQPPHSATLQLPCTAEAASPKLPPVPSPQQQQQPVPVAAAAGGAPAAVAVVTAAPSLPAAAGTCGPLVASAPGSVTRPDVAVFGLPLMETSSGLQMGLLPPFLYLPVPPPPCAAGAAAVVGVPPLLLAPPGSSLHPGTMPHATSSGMPAVVPVLRIAAVPALPGGGRPAGGEAASSAVARAHARAARAVVRAVARAAARAVPCRASKQHRKLLARVPPLQDLPADGGKLPGDSPTAGTVAAGAAGQASAAAGGKQLQPDSAPAGEATGVAVDAGCSPAQQVQSDMAGKEGSEANGQPLPAGAPCAGERPSGSAASGWPNANSTPEPKVPRRQRSKRGGGEANLRDAPTKRVRFAGDPSLDGEGWGGCNQPEDAEPAGPIQQSGTAAAAPGTAAGGAASAVQPLTPGLACQGAAALVSPPALASCSKPGPECPFRPLSLEEYAAWCQHNQQGQLQGQQPLVQRGGEQDAGRTERVCTASGQVLPGGSIPGADQPGPAGEGAWKVAGRGSSAGLAGTEGGSSHATQPQHACAAADGGGLGANAPAVPSAPGDTAQDAPAEQGKAQQGRSAGPSRAPPPTAPGSRCAANADAAGAPQGSSKDAAAATPGFGSGEFEFRAVLNRLYAKQEVVVGWQPTAAMATRATDLLHMNNAFCSARTAVVRTNLAAAREGAGLQAGITRGDARVHAEASQRLQQAGLGRKLEYCRQNPGLWERVSEWPWWQLRDELFGGRRPRRCQACRQEGLAGQLAAQRTREDPEPCEECGRAYHPSCLHHSERQGVAGMWYCPACRPLLPEPAAAAGPPPTPPLPSAPHLHAAQFPWQTHATPFAVTPQKPQQQQPQYQQHAGTPPMGAQAPPVPAAAVQAQPQQQPSFSAGGAAPSQGLPPAGAAQQGLLPRDMAPQALLPQHAQQPGVPVLQPCQGSQLQGHPPAPAAPQASPHSMRTLPVGLPWQQPGQAAAQAGEQLAQATGHLGPAGTSSTAAACVLPAEVVSIVREGCKDETAAQALLGYLAAEGLVDMSDLEYVDYDHCVSELESQGVTRLRLRRLRDLVRSRAPSD